MEPTSGYLTLSPSTSTTRGILIEPLESIQEPLERIQEPLELIQEPLEHSQGISECIQELSGRLEEQPEGGLAQENSEPSEETIDRIAELIRIEDSWTAIGKEVGLTPDACIQIWDKHQRAQAIPNPVSRRRSVPWKQSEDELLLQLHEAGINWDLITASLTGRTKAAVQRRFRKRFPRLHSGSEITTVGPNDLNALGRHVIPNRIAGILCSEESNDQPLSQ